LPTAEPVMAPGQPEVVSETRAAFRETSEDGATRGYQLALDVEERSGGFFEFKHGTLYPTLHKLEKERLIEGAWSDEGPRGKRRHYRVTEKGGAYARAQREGWRAFVDHLVAVIGRQEK
jgi:PadR family transcriptional regulator